MSLGKSIPWWFLPPLPTKLSLGQPPQKFLPASAMTILSSSSPSPRQYQTVASPSRGKIRGRGRQNRRESLQLGRLRQSRRWEDAGVEGGVPSVPAQSPGDLANIPLLRTRPSPDPDQGGTDSSDSPTTCASPLPPGPRGDACPYPTSSGPWVFLSGSRPRPRRVTGPRGGNRKRLPFGTAGATLRLSPPTGTGRRIGTERSGRPRGTWSRPGLPHLPHTGRGWHLLRRLWISSEWLAPPDFQAIARHTRSRYRTTFSAATVPSSFPKSETTSHTVTAPLASPLWPPLWLPSPLLPPLRAPGMPRGTHAPCDAARPRVRPGWGRRRGWLGAQPPALGPVAAARDWRDGPAESAPPPLLRGLSDAAGCATPLCWVCPAARRAGWAPAWSVSRASLQLWSPSAVKGW